MKPHLRITIATLLNGGASQRKIERLTGVDRKTIRGVAREANSPGVATGSEVAAGQIPPPRPPANMGGVAVATKAAGSISAFVEITSAGIRESHVHDVQIVKEAPNYRGD